MESVRNIVSVLHGYMQSIKISPCIRLHPAAYENHVQSELCMEKWRTAWRFQIFLIATHLFLFIHDVLYAHIRQHKKILCCTKTVVSTKKIFHIEVNVAQQNYVSHKKICCGDKKRYVTPKRRLMLTKYVSCCTEKEYVFTNNDSCCM